MRSRILVVALAIGVWLAASSPITAQGSRNYVLTAAGWSAAQAAAVASAGGTVVFSHAGAGVAVVRSSAPDFLQRMRASYAIDSADPDAVVRWQWPGPTETVTANFTNPPNNDRFFNHVQWAPQAVDAPAAWAAGCTGEGVRVAILDGGIWDEHPDLAPNLDTALSASFVPDQPYNTDVGTFWHGTHVAGIVAAADDSGDVNSGVIGIAPKATIIGVKVLHDGSGTFGAVIEGILYAATPIDQGGAGADIINMSLGVLVDRKEDGARELLKAVRKAVRFASRKGVLVIAAAGNDALDLDHSGKLVVVPAESGNGIAVSATGPEGFALGAVDFDRVSSYTNYGRTVIDVAAPGGDFTLAGEEVCTVPTTDGAPLTQPCWVFDMVMSTNVDGWAWAAGTSMAAPAASAVAALIIQSHPHVRLGRLKAILRNSAIDAGETGKDPFYGRGWINALRACQY